MDSPQTVTVKERKRRKLSHRARLWLIWTIALVVALLIVLFYLWAKRYVLYTADAYVEANWVPISAEVDGYITQVFVQDNQWVDAGQPLFEIDPLPYLYEVNQRRGELETNLKLQQRLLRELDVASAGIEARRSQLGISIDRLERAVPLLSEEFVSEERAVDFYFTVKKDEATLAEAEHSYSRIQAELGPGDQPFSEVVTAQANLDRAEYFLSKTFVTAPVSGWVTGFYIRPGQYVDDRRPLFSIVDPSSWWATARFKDVAIGNIREGASAKVWVDMYWNELFDGVVQGIDAGVNRHQDSPNAAKSSLPYVEKTEYWIRLAQRFQVRITITDPRAQEALRIGANCRIFIRRGGRGERSSGASCKAQTPVPADVRLGLKAKSDGNSEKVLEDGLEVADEILSGACEGPQGEFHSLIGSCNECQVVANTQDRP